MVGRTLRLLLFLLLGIPVAACALGVLIAGWVVVTCLAITPLVVPALIGFRGAVGGLAWFEAELANELLGTSVRPPVVSAGPKGFWQRGRNVLLDSAFWRQQVYLVVRMTAGFGLAVAQWTLLATSLSLIVLPIWYRWTDVDLGDRHPIDTFARSLVGVPIGIAGTALALALVRPLTAGSRFLVDRLLGDAGRLRLRAPAALRAHALAFGCLTGLFVGVWGLTTRATFWPAWPILALAFVLAVHAWVAYVVTSPEAARLRAYGRALPIEAGIVVLLTLFHTGIWILSGRGYFWPVWPLLGLAVVVGVQAAISIASAQEKAPLAERIEELTASRAGAVDQQESELRRIERDLHDGAQARLVALGMSLGLAEQKLASDPDAAQQLLAEARRGTREALEELRNLARGIHPPVLADRGLSAAIAALADRTPLNVRLAIDLPRRPPAAIESAAYFVVAESLANTGKHANAGQVEIDAHYDDGRLVVRVTDDGEGGADPEGSGLRGLARRVGALDGRLGVYSPAGGPTTIEAVIPCGL